MVDGAKLPSSRVKNENSDARGFPCKTDHFHKHRETCVEPETQTDKTTSPEQRTQALEAEVESEEEALKLKCRETTHDEYTSFFD